ncbi:MAG TPA: MerR family transcriptional regulator [Steroidobacteraceae bacterium]|nr:MerR family transcriptional regulator [Steroidobacteraceae bacterium]
MTAVSHISGKVLRIGELAARTGHTVHAIRWYEAQGLIPGVIRDAGGRRSYRDRHLSWIQLIQKLRLTGMSIAQIRDYAALVAQGRGTLKQQQAMLRAHRVRVEKTIEDWKVALQMLDHKIDYFEEWLTTGQRPDKKAVVAAAQSSNSVGRRLKRRATA